MFSTEQVIFNFNVSNCQKDYYYQVSIINEDLSLGNRKEFKTNLLKCEKEGDKLIFKETVEYNFDFSKIQNLKIFFIIKVKENSNFNTKRAIKEIVMSSLLFSHNCIYKKPFNKNYPDKNIFCIEINKKSTKSPTFFDFLKSGVKLLSFIAIDFSNGKNQQLIDVSKDNYTIIIKQLVNKLSFYTKNFYLYGYGAKLKTIQNSNLLYHSAFNINQDNESSDNKNIIDIYKSFSDYSPDNKVLFSELIRKVTKHIYKLYNIRYYNLLFILARELTSDDDKQNTIDSFIESGYLPFSIIIICIGKNEFKKMKQLYGKKIKESSNGMKKIRNNILSICFTDDYDEDEERMIEWCMREISSHILEYFNLNMCSPDIIKENKTNENIENSINKNKSSIMIYESKMSSIYESQKKEIEEINEFDILNVGSIPDLKSINIINMNSSKLSDINNKSDELNKKNKFDTPNPTTGEYIIQNDSIMEETGYNIYNQNKEKKYTPGKSFNVNFENKNSNNNKDYKIILDSVEEEIIKENPYQKNEKYKIPEFTSIAPSINYNPYLKNDKKYYINQQSIIEDTTNINNHYKKDNHEKNINTNNYKNNIINTSIASEFLSTNNSNNNQARNSNVEQLNYSIDSKPY